ncbi:SfnB family sulfur acquisition oxidoreductase [Achromobacter aloeverae]|uniref:SfnB family sulfur acquisition oxidoreductase n=1 Tax=Achromobacter aloeverae TaxID=1750518 RepID=A0A4Q1HMS4_9BURK|nr:SfnB family sulfur acquisition oxidoreductase [Achromobacter aloeverae]RXN91242.1 SfnB family sulfur acquisition oxidoreductase [Achromobacter aloeverae]
MPLTESSAPPAARTTTQTPARRLETEAEVLQTVERLAAGFRNGAIERDRDRRLPHGEIAALKRAGVFAITVPRQHGGLGASAATVAEVFRILSKADPSIGQIPQNHFCFLPVFSFGTPEQAAFFHGRVLAGDSIGNAHNESTRHRAGTYEHQLARVDGGWTVSGRKFYSTGAAFAEWIPFIGYDDQQRQLMFFVDAKAKGVSIVNDWSGMGQRTTASGSTLFDNVFIPDFNVFPYHLAGDSKRPTRLLAALIHAAIDLGIAEEAQDDLRRYILDQTRPWIDNPHPRHAQEPFIVQAYGETGHGVRTAARLLKAAAADIDHAWADGGKEAALQAGLATADARIACANAALKVSDQLFALTGARATLAQYDLDRHWRNARTHTLHDPLRWKLFHLGNYYLNGIEPGPRSLI